MTSQENSKNELLDISSLESYVWEHFDGDLVSPFGEIKYKAKSIIYIPFPIDTVELVRERLFVGIKDTALRTTIRLSRGNLMMLAVSTDINDPNRLLCSINPGFSHDNSIKMESVEGDDAQLLAGAMLETISELIDSDGFEYVGHAD